MRKTLYRSVALLAAFSLVMPPPVFAQPAPAPAAVAGAEATVYSAEQLDALLAPIALYPDALLAQVLMAATFPLQVVDAERWVEVPANKALAGDALAQALASEDWDPSVKSLVPFPQVLAMLSGKLDWMQQLGYAFATQQADVMDSVQRLRQQAQAAGYLKTTDQQRVVVENSAIVIEPVVPTTVYVPVYSPTIVYGTWAYPAYPPVYIPPPPGYVVGSAFLTGMAFATGVAVVGSLWGWARPGWGGHSVNVNVNTYNNINVNRPPIHSPVWRPPAGGVGGRPIHPPGGPVGVPGRPGTLPAGGGGRPHPHRGPGAAGGHHPGGAHHPGTTPPRPGRTPGATTHGTHAGQPAHHGAPTHGTQPRTPARPHNAGGGAAKAAGPSHGGGHSTKPVK